LVPIEKLIHKRPFDTSKSGQTQDNEFSGILRHSKEGALKKSLSPLKSVNNPSKVRNINITAQSQTSVDILK